LYGCNAQNINKALSIPRAAPIRPPGMLFKQAFAEDLPMNAA
jgi:hypothetical protein